MNSYDDRIGQLMTVISGRAHAQAALDELTRQRRDLEKKVADLNYVRISEQEDVDKLETGSIRNLVLGLLGKKEEMLEKERAELAAAILKYDLAKRELEAVKELEFARLTELNRCGRAEEEYEKLLAEKTDYIGSKDDPDAEEIDWLRQRIAKLEAACAELNEAVRAGKRAEALAASALRELDFAKMWSTVDMFGGGLISDAMKYDQIDAARRYIEKLQAQLRVFSAELADTVMVAQGNVMSDGLFRFADYYFDGIFTASSARKRISRCISSVEEIHTRLQSELRRLENRLHEEENTLSVVKEQLRNKVIHTKA